MTPSVQRTKVLAPDDVLAAYSIGMFPMAEPSTGEISWYAPDPRGIIELDRVKAPRSLRRVMHSGLFDVRWNSAFEQTVLGCADRPETWISPGILAAYLALHRQGWAHSIECWESGSLAGGLYGVAIGGAFFGESMFSRRRDASKVALMHLVDRMKARGYTLLDTQFMTEHLSRFGGAEIPREEYLRRLRQALRQKCLLHP